MRFSQNMNSEDRLANLPKFAAWVLSQQSKPPTIKALPELHLWNIAKALKSKEPLRTKIWIENIEQISNINPNLMQHIIDTDHLAVALGISLTELYTELSESSVITGNGNSAFSALQIFADQSKLAAFRFLCAWIAFNMDDFDQCIQECELVDEPFSPIQTLLGQALLERGQVADAIDSLKTAAELDHSDPLPLVQLIKAYIISGLQSEAIKCIEKCRNILGQNIEIECLASMVILMEPNQSPEFAEKTLARLGMFFESHPTDLELFSMATNLALDLRRADWTQKYMEQWECAADTNPFQVAGKISEILKKTGALQWHELTKYIIDKALQFTGSKEALTPMQ